MFSTEESQDTALNSIFQKATQEQRTGIKAFFRKFILWIKEKLGKTSYTEQLQMLKDKWINLIKNSEATEKIIEAETRRKSSSESASIKDDKSSNNNISNNPENVKKKFSISPENIRYNQERYVNWLLNTQYKLNVKEDAVNKFAKELKHISALDNGTAKQKAEAKELLDELSKKMADEYNVPLIPEAQELLRYIRNTKFSLTETQKQEARDKYGSVTNIILISINQVE